MPKKEMEMLDLGHLFIHMLQEWSSGQANENRFGTVEVDLELSITRDAGDDKAARRPLLRFNKPLTMPPRMPPSWRA